MGIKRFIKLLLPGYLISDKILYRHRLAHFFYEKRMEKLANFCSYRIYKKYKCCISYKAKLGNNILFPHPVGIVIGEGVEIGNNCVIYQNVTIGRKYKEVYEYPKLEDNVTIYCNSALLGNIIIGKNSIIGCNTVVLRSTEHDSKSRGVVK